MGAKIKKIFYWVLSALLILSTLAMFSMSCEEPAEPVRTWDANQIKYMNARGYTVKVKDDAVYFLNPKPEHDLSWQLNKETFNYVEVHLAEPIPANTALWLSYSNDPVGYFYPDKVAFGTVTGDNDIIAFSLPRLPDGSALRLSISGAFSVEEIRIYDFNGATTAMRFNPIALCILLGLLLILLIIEKKFGYYRWIISGIKNEVTRCKEIFKESKWRFVLHAVTLTTTSAFFVTAAVTVMRYAFSAKTILWLFILASAAMILGICDRIISKRGAEPAKLFLVIALISGIMFCCTMPISTHVSWDDEIHLRNAYTIADPINNESSLGKLKIFSHAYRVADYNSDPLSFIKTLVQEDAHLIDFDIPSVTAYTVISYSPMISAIFLSRLLQLDMAKMIVLCRLANAILFAVVCYLGIKKLKSGAYVAVASALLPGTLFLGAVCGYDFWLTAWMVYIFCYIISIFQDRERTFTAVDITKILVAFFLGCSAKPIYLVLMLPLLFIPKLKFKTPKHSRLYRVITVAVMLVILGAVLIPGLLSNNLYTDTRGGSDVSSIDQIIYALTHPFTYAYTLLKHIGEYCSLRNFVNFSAIYGYLANYGENPFAFFGTLSAVILVFAMFTDRKEDDLYSDKYMQRLRWQTLVTCFIQVVLISSLFYATFTPVGADYINGCQYRYLFPLIFPFCFFLVPRGITVKMNETFKKSVIFAALLFNILYGYWTIYIMQFAGV